MGDFGSVDDLSKALARWHTMGASCGYLPAKGNADRLVTEADSEDWERMKTQELECETDVLRGC